MSKTRTKPAGLTTANVERLLLADQTKAKATRAAKAAERKQAAELTRIAKQAEIDAAVVRTVDAEVAETVERGLRIAAVALDEAEDALRAQRVDFDALFEAGSILPGTSFADYLLSQGFNADGTPSKAHNAKTPYSGPMCALKTARRTYVKAANGILCNGSPLAMLCGQYSRDVVVAALIDALKLPGNPYLLLNPGQQSMNLRNKARHAINELRLSIAEVEACLKAHAA